MDTNTAIEKAINRKTLLKVIYHGGSMKGQLRDITPISIKGDNIRARCHITNKIKTFKASRMEVMDQNGVLTEAIEKPASNVPNITTLKELSDFIKNDKKLSEWHIVYEENSLSLHRKFKNGKALKSSALSLSYEDIGFDLIYEIDGSLTTEVYEKNKPWHLHSEIGKSNFKYIDNAIKKFLSHVQQISPKRD